MGSQLMNLFKKVEWSDYTKVNRTPPGPGQTAIGAQTAVDILPLQIGFAPVSGSKPPVYQLRDDVTMTIALNRGKCWVATWVFTRSQTFQDALLNHERGHYWITAIMARDFFIEIMGLKGTDYSSTKAGAADFKEIAGRYDGPTIQAVHDKYDDTDQVNHDPETNSKAQAKWDGCFQKAIQFKKPLLDVLSDAGLSP